MRIDSFSVKNYKGYRDSKVITFDPKWNIIIGQNNAGKSALIEVLRIYGFENKPHRGPHLPPGVSPPPQSQIDFTLTLSPDDVKSAILNYGSRVTFPVPSGTSQPYEASLKNLLSSTDTSYAIRRVPNESLSIDNYAINKLPQREAQQTAIATPLPDRSNYDIQLNYGSERSYLDAIVRESTRKIYVFNAKRFGKGTCPHADTDSLDPDATNIAAVISKLNLNPARLDEFERHINTIFPSIKAVRSAQGGEGLEIRVWPLDPKTQRNDLTVPLDECGTGVSQVLAMVYVAINSAPGTIVIDEPNSFLNPGATKKLLSILSQYKDHQYIISTHSPDVINSIKNPKLFVVKNTDNESQIDEIDKDIFGYQKSILEELGASQSDIFGSDRVVWVEGPTERDCFLAIYEHINGCRPTKFTIAPLRATGDLEGPYADSTLDIYAALSRGGAILPTTIAFSFDREKMNDSQVRDLKKRLGGLAHVLPRSMIENYLLDHDAINDLLRNRNIDQISNKPLIEMIHLAISEQPKILPKGIEINQQNPDFLAKVDGARMISSIVHQISDGRYEYRKVQDGPILLTWLLNNKPESVQELTLYVRDLLGD